MADYRVLYTDLVTGTMQGVLPSASVSFDHGLNSPGGVTVKMPLEPDNPVTKDVLQSYWESVLVDAPIGLFKLNDTTTVMADTSGSRHGTYVNGPTQQVAGPTGSRIPIGTEFDQATEYAVVSAPEGDTFHFNDNEAFTIEFWLYLPVAAAAAGRFLSNDSGGSDGWAFRDATGPLRFVRGSDSVDSSVSVVTAVWHHIAATYNGTDTISLYVDGVLDATAGSTAALVSTSTDVTLNAKSDSLDTPAGGHYAGLAFYNSDLGATRIGEHYTLGTGTLLETVATDLPDPIGLNTLTPGAVALYVERDDVIQWGGILWSTQADVGANTLTLSGEGFHSYFRKRLITADAAFVVATHYQENIAGSLLTTAQAVSNGDLGITSTSVTSGTKRDRTYLGYELKNVGEAIEQLAAVQDGFDWRYQSAWVSGVITNTFETEYPATGRATAHVFELGINVSLLSVNTNGTSLVTKAYATGGGNAVGGVDSISKSAVSGATAYPLLEVLESFNDVRREATLQDKATRRVARGSIPIENIKVEVYADTLPALGSYLVGDLVEVRGAHGVLSVSGTYRIMSISVSVGSNGQETINVGLVPSGVFS